MKRKRSSSSSRPGVISGTSRPPVDEREPDAELTDPLAMFDCSPRMRALSEVVREVARTDATVLVRGESGVERILLRGQFMQPRLGALVHSC